MSGFVIKNMTTEDQKVGKTTLSPSQQLVFNRLPTDQDFNDKLDAGILKIVGNDENDPNQDPPLNLDLT